MIDLVVYCKDFLRKVGGVGWQTLGIGLLTAFDLLDQLVQAF